MSNDLGQLPAPVSPDAPQRGWPLKRLILLTLFVLIAQAAFIIFFGEKKAPEVRTVKDAPHFQVTDQNSDLVALDDPTLFALPHNNDFGAQTWLGPLNTDAPSFAYDEVPHWLEPNIDDFGADLRLFLQTNVIATSEPPYKPAAQMSEPTLLLAPELDAKTTMQIRGDLANRRRLAEPELPPLTNNDLVSHSRVQILVNAAGDVVSAIKLPTGSLVALPDDSNGKGDGDARALELVRQLRFAAAAAPATFGQVTFNWHTVITNTP